jgi:hypothetical protein
MQQTGQNVTTANIPSYLQPSYNQLISQVGSTYGGTTPDVYSPTALSSQLFSSASQPANQNLGGLAQNVLGSGNNIIGGLAQGVTNAGTNTSLGDMSQNVLQSGNNVLGSTASGLLGGSQPQWTDPGVAQSWMNPYTNSALQSQIDIANQQYQEQQAGRNQQAIQAGAFGGSRQGISDAVSQNLYNQNINNMVQQAQQTAYNTGEQGFMGQQGLNLQSTGLGGQLQALQNQYGLAIPQLASSIQNMQNQYGLQVPTTAAQLQNLQNSYGLQTPQLAGSLMGSQNQLDLQQLGLLQSAAGTQQGLQTSQGLLPYQLQSQEASLLGTMPGAQDQTSAQYQKVNPWSGILGMLGNVASATAGGLAGKSKGGLIEGVKFDEGGLIEGLRRDKVRAPAYGLAEAA